MSLLNSLGGLLRSAAPIIGTALGGPIGGAIAGGAAGLLGSRAQARGQEAASRESQQMMQQGALQANNALGNYLGAAGQSALGGLDYLAGSPIGTQYSPAGGAAIAQQQALLGIGADPDAAARAYQDYQNSTGFQSALDAGGRAITGSAAARGLLGSGSTAKALQTYGTQLGQQNFNNYLNQLSGVSGMGLQAGSMLGGAAQQGYGQLAGQQMAAGQQAASNIFGAGMQGSLLHHQGRQAATDTRAGGWDQAIGGLGGAWDAWQNR